LEVSIFVSTGILDLLLLFRALAVVFRRYFLDDPGQSEVAYFNNKALSVDEYVGRFEVPVNDVRGVQVFESV
jgi:hypothetical protein